MPTLIQYLAQHWNCLDILDFPFIPIPRPHYHGHNELLIECYRWQPIPDKCDMEKFKEEIMGNIVEEVMSAEKKKVDFWSVRVVSYMWSKIIRDDEDGCYKEMINKRFEKEGVKVRFNRLCGQDYGDLIIDWRMGYVLYEVIRIK